MTSTFKPFPTQRTFERSLHPVTDDQITDICYICHSPQKSTTPPEDRGIGPPVLMTCCPAPRVVGKECLKSWLNSPASGVNKCIACSKLLYHMGFYKRVIMFLTDEDPLDRNAVVTFVMWLAACLVSVMVAPINLGLYWAWLRQHRAFCLFLASWWLVRPWLQNLLGLFLQIPRKSRKARVDDPVDTVMGVFFPLLAFEMDSCAPRGVAVYPDGEDCDVGYRLMMWLRTCGLSKRWVWRKYWSDRLLKMQAVNLEVWVAFAIVGLLRKVIRFISMMTGVEV